MTPIQEFYSDRSIFITGATGFIGKVLLEKFLRSCPNIEKIYVLIRPKENQTVETRTKNLLNNKIFSYLHAINESVFEKVIGISGDILLPSLGLCLADKELLVNDVSVVFHGAASIKYNDTLKFATQLNVHGTLKVVELCKLMRKLIVFTHISTAFSNCNRNFTGEEIYPVNLDPNRLLSISDWLEEHVSESSVAMKLVGNRITTYHMTKSITEKILETESVHLPITIVRPSLVVGAWKEPLEGYTETLYHINGILVAVGRGVLRVLHCNPDYKLDIIPVDLVTNLIIACAWEKGNQNTSHGLNIYNCVSGADNPLTYRQLHDYSLPVLRTKPFLYPVWYPGFSLVRYKQVAILMMFFLHTIPAVVGDSFLKLLGMKPLLGKIAKKIQRSQSYNAYFMNNDFNFSNQNVKDLWSKLCKKDKDIFNFDVSQLPWKQYLEGYILGCKQYVLDEELSTLPRAQMQMKIMKFIYYFLSWAIVISLMYWFLWVFSSSDDKLQ